MRVHLPGPEHEVMDPAPALYTIRINGHLGAMVLSAFPAMMPPIEGAVAPAPESCGSPAPRQPASDPATAERKRRIVHISVHLHRQTQR
jgi:hypothetical protein